MLALIGFVGACAPESPIDSSSNGPSESLVESTSSEELYRKFGRNIILVPFKARGEGSGTEASAEPACDEGFFPTGNIAHGTGTHIGKFTSVHRQCVNFETFEFRDGTVTFHAANGDQLHATFEGVLSPTDEAGVLSFDNPAYGSGGTGRFKDAKGLFRAYGLVNLNDNTFKINVEGMLALPKGK